MTGLHHLYPFSSHFLEINGLSYHYLDEGRGDPIVMVHGNPTWSFYFRNLVRGLSPNYRTIVPDHMGCGLSDKPGEDRYDFRLSSRIHDLEFLLDRLGLNKPITLILHDWGGAIGLGYALRHPDRISRIILMNTAAFFPPKGKKLPLRLQILKRFGALARIAVLGGNLFSRAALVMAPRKALGRAVMKGLCAPYNSWNNRMATLKFVEDIPLAPSDPSYSLLQWLDHHLHQLSPIPMLILWGMHDFVFDPDYLTEWQRRFPQARIHRYPQAGHYLLEDEPERILKDILNFLKSPVSCCNLSNL
ncbi:MAG: alpha/beta fold hydrolase [Deltaproteobacteria bacterium]|nr:alpha/beta fold hydrolase [Deltaproteobacteria bacterium]